MKTPKKILLGLVPLLLVVFLLNFFADAKVEAVDENTFDGATFTVNRARDTIVVQLRGMGSEEGQSYNFTDSNPSDETLNFKYVGNLSDGYACAGRDNQGITVQGGSWPTGPTSVRATLAVVLLDGLNRSPNDCFFDFDPGDVAAIINEGVNVRVPGEGEEDPGGGSGGAESADDVSGCIDVASIYLAWIICPVIAGIGEAVEGLNKIVENLLQFNVDEFLPDGGRVQQAWSAFRVLATSVLIIVMLIMIISHALGRGPFA